MTAKKSVRPFGSSVVRLFSCAWCRGTTERPNYRTAERFENIVTGRQAPRSTRTTFTSIIISPTRWDGWCCDSIVEKLRRANYFPPAGDGHFWPWRLARAGDGGNPYPIDGREIPMSERLVPVNGREVLWKLMRAGFGVLRIKGSANYLTQPQAKRTVNSESARAARLSPSA